MSRKSFQSGLYSNLATTRVERRRLLFIEMYNFKFDPEPWKRNIKWFWNFISTLLFMDVPQNFETFHSVLSEKSDIFDIKIVCCRELKRLKKNSNLMTN